MDIRKKSFAIDGRDIYFETGRMARQADGSVLVGENSTTVIVTAVASRGKESDRGYFPLFVEYREKFYAAGKIPGGFFKREGRPTEREVVSCRLIDRPIRPLFPDSFNYEVQVACNVLSSDQDHQADVLGITGASIALNMSDIPFDTILSGVRIGMKDGRFILDPTFTEVDEGGMDIVVAGTDEAIVMVEGGANEISEDMLLDALDFAHQKIRELNDKQREFLSGCSKPEKRSVNPKEMDSELEQKIRSEYTEKLRELSTLQGKLNRQRAIADMLCEALWPDLPD